MRDVRGSLDRLLAAIRAEYPDEALDRAEQYMDDPARSAADGEANG